MKTWEMLTFGWQSLEKKEDQMQLWESLESDWLDSNSKKLGMATDFGMKRLILNQ